MYITTFTITLNYHYNNYYIITYIFIIFSQLFKIILTSVLLYLYNNKYTPYETNNDNIIYKITRYQKKSPYPTRKTKPYTNLYTN